MRRELLRLSATVEVAGLDAHAGLPTFGPLCWRCGAPVGQQPMGRDTAEAGDDAPTPSPAEPFEAPVRCLGCDVLLPPDPHQNAFERLGLALRFAQSPGAVDAARRTRLLAVHPDRFTRRPPLERALALAWAVTINDAGRTLQEAFDRAQHLITLRRPDAFPARIRDADWQRLYELKQVLRELDGVDAHVERSRLTRLVVAEYEQGLTELGRDLDDGEAPVESLAPRLAWLRSLRSVVETLQA
jgi:hypothetical protein